ncbi:MAG: hypothetical protein HKO66_00190 [Saprospiraceae bacterium]|nr:HlyD family secretion protein [Bacteroidia bacterium]NNE14816.1 hypothetical protein [Saprospiraceae bacterium]NNL90625.1 hypothetical protein [Saprospiraceae bacterium]
MKRINIYYFVIFLLGLFLWNIFVSQKHEQISFYGFAETRETEINYNHPVRINTIYVGPGQSVVEGEKLLEVSRIKSKESLQDQDFIVSELLSKAEKWTTQMNNKIEILNSNFDINNKKLDAEIKVLQDELKYKQSLTEEITSINKNSNSGFINLRNKIKALQDEKKYLKNKTETEKKALELEKTKGLNPYYKEIDRLNASKEFEVSQQVQTFDVLAPSNGLIGNIQCKEAEHIPAFKTLLSFYEPNPSYIKAFVHEDLILEVNPNDNFNVNSIKNASYSINGKVIGLGSRIVEIPERLRKVPDYKTYGREVTIEISSDNNFLQKEKVILELQEKNDKSSNLSVSK